MIRYNYCLKVYKKDLTSLEVFWIKLINLIKACKKVTLLISIKNNLNYQKESNKNAKIFLNKKSKKHKIGLKMHKLP